MNNSTTGTAEQLAEAKILLSSLYQVDHFDALCRREDQCFRPPNHDGRCLTYDEYETYLLKEIAELS